MAGGKTILVVDDEADIVNVLRIILSQDGVKVLSAYDGLEALDIARRERPDLVISDVMMPGMDGLELCRAIRSDPELADTRVVLMSAVHKLGLIDSSEDAFIPKPFGIEMVEATVERLLSEVL